MGRTDVYVKLVLGCSLHVQSRIVDHGEVGRVHVRAESNKQQSRRVEQVRFVTVAVMQGSATLHSMILVICTCASLARSPFAPRDGSFPGVKIQQQIQWWKSWWWTRICFKRTVLSRLMILLLFCAHIFSGTVLSVGLRTSIAVAIITQKDQVCWILKLDP
jgi:hypothetical protein